jgi:acetolactate synthase small subunit
MARTLALIKVRCDQFTRDPLLQTMAATNWRIVLFRPTWIDIEVVGTGQEVADFCEFIRADGNSQACSPPQLLTSLS